MMSVYSIKSCIADALKTTLPVGVQAKLEAVLDAEQVAECREPV
jgi:hypothetical protein